MLDIPSPDLERGEYTRYSRHLLLPEIGLPGQKKLKGAKVLIVGAGGLGSPLALYLAAAGVGTIGLVDSDAVEESNLQRQIIHSTRDIDRPKTASAGDRLRGINPYITVNTHDLRLTAQNAADIIKDYDIVADGTDNYQARYLINDVCVFLKKPNVFGAVFRFEGQASVFDAERGPCLRCLFPAPPPPGLVPGCSVSGVMGVLPGIVGTIQACEVIKLIVGAQDTLIGRLLIFDAWKMQFRELKLLKEPHCPVCGVTSPGQVDYEEFCGLRKHTGEAPAETITAIELKARLDAGEKIQLVDIREPHEQAIFRFPGARVMTLGQVARRIGEFTPEHDIVFLCKTGVRSIYAIQALREAGYTGRALNLHGGVYAWVRDVDTTLPLY
ncbi:MAG: molybdopterin-synthase adenylyltransferase MoeB [Spirochaetota bacterium]|jgi:adenylyltransferase/sulfurtransferase|nr:molybdopterin-synthase adenylyltransferase MoeB [Spirochaetota bacterium]